MSTELVPIPRSRLEDVESRIKLLEERLTRRTEQRLEDVDGAAKLLYAKDSTDTSPTWNGIGEPLREIYRIKARAVLAWVKGGEG